MELNKLFDNIMDLPGIEGVCLFGIEGEVYVNRLPSFIVNDIFADAQRRITALYETMDENFLPCDDYLLKFSEKWLMLRRHEQQVLLVLANEKANLTSTRMVTNMTMKHLTPESLVVPSPTLAPAVPTAPSVSPVSPSVGVAQLSAAEVAPLQVAAEIAAPVVAEATAVLEPAPATASAAPPKPVRMYRGRPIY